MLFSSSDESYMRRALDLADLPSKCLLPNPRVGAVIVHEGKIVGEGCHLGPGTHHAELAAILNAEKSGFKNFSEAEIFITLEPCFPHAKKLTPPCAPLIAEKKFKRVVIAMKDPNPKVSGRGLKLIQKAGLQVELGCLEEEAEKLNQAFIKNQKFELPYITIKLATTFDGKMFDDFGRSKWITSEDSREDAQFLRLKVDAIGVGRKTIEADNPSLNCRRPGWAPVTKKIVVFGKLKKLSKSLNIVKANGLENITVVSKKKSLKPTLRALLKNQKIHHILIEGGPTLISALLAEKLADEAILYLGKGFMGGKGSGSLKIGGGLKSLGKSITFAPQEVKLLASDIRIQGYFHVYRTD